MKDSADKEITVGDICFYSERPFSNYADSLVEVYEKDGCVFVGTLVFNNMSGYVEHESPHHTDVQLKHSATSGDNTKSETLTIIGISRGQATVDYANENHTLGKQF